jgi:EAL domain-containing protein (putative c-di-GMP-specific phosphodiesterase class I)
LNRISACRWSEDDRRRLFDPDFLARRCARDPLLAELCDLVWRQGVERLRQTGENPAAVALDVMGYGRECGRYRRVTAVRLP